MRFGEQIREIARLVNHAHAATAAAKRGLDDQRKANLLRDLQRFATVFNRVFRARQHRHVDLLRKRAGGGFVAHVAEQIHARADENNSRLLARFRKIRVLGQKAVAGMDEVHALLFRERDDAGDVEIGTDRAFAFADDIGLIRLEAVDGEPVFLRVNGDGAQAEFRRGAEDADGDLAAVGDEQFALADGGGG